MTTVQVKHESNGHKPRYCLSYCPRCEREAWQQRCERDKFRGRWYERRECQACQAEYAVPRSTRVAAELDALHANDGRPVQLGMRS